MKATLTRSVAESRRRLETPFRAVRANDRGSVEGAMVAGAIGGILGSSCMTVVRTLAQRANLVEKTVPQVMEEWVVERTGLQPPGEQRGHEALDQVLHLGYGMAWGGLYGLVFGRSEPATLWRGGAFGLTLWAVGLFGLVPLLRVTRGAWQAAPAENLVNMTAHLVYGIVTALITEEVTRQPEHRATSPLHRFGVRVG